MRYALALLLLALPVPAAAQLRPLVDPPADAASAAERGVDVFVINEGASPAPVAAPDTLETIAKDGTLLKLSLVRSTTDTGPVAAGGFARLRYRLAPLAEAPAMAAAETPPAPLRPRPAMPAPREEVVTASRGSASGFFDRIRPHEPSYLVVGAGDDGAKLQLSLAVRPFGGRSLLAYLNLAYTQTVFLAVNRASGPVTATNYSPEVYFEAPWGDSTQIALGYRHDSNGGGLTNSYDLNRVFVRFNQRFDLGRDWRLDVAPQGWAIVAGRALAQDIDRFYGYGGIHASLAQTDGLKLALDARGNPATGKGAAELFLSYPLARFRFTRSAGLYLFAQGFTGYGEALQNYNRESTALRVGLSITR